MKVPPGPDGPHYFTEEWETLAVRGSDLALRIKAGQLMDQFLDNLWGALRDAWPEGPPDDFPEAVSAALGQVEIIHHWSRHPDHMRTELLESVREIRAEQATN